jgi:hypothetical protein
MARVGGFANVGTWVWNSVGTYRMNVRTWNRDHNGGTDTAARFFAQDLLTSHPTVFIDEVDPILQYFQTEGIIPSSNV